MNHLAALGLVQLADSLTTNGPHARLLVRTS